MCARTRVNKYNSVYKYILINASFMLKEDPFFVVITYKCCFENNFVYLFLEVNKNKTMK